jgi:hypothetical protein
VGTKLPPLNQKSGRGVLILDAQSKSHLAMMWRFLKSYKYKILHCKFDVLQRDKEKSCGDENLVKISYNIYKQSRMLYYDETKINSKFIQTYALVSRSQ